MLLTYYWLHLPTNEMSTGCTLRQLLSHQLRVRSSLLHILLELTVPYAASVPRAEVTSWESRLEAAAASIEECGKAQEEYEQQQRQLCAYISLRTLTYWRGWLAEKRAEKSGIGVAWRVLTRGAEHHK